MKKNKQGCYHTKATCVGEYCCFHNPSDHKMNNWPMTIRLDRGGLTERICDHGIGHPDPDSLNWINRMAKKYKRLGDSGVHGCDGCCMEKSGRAPLPTITPISLASQVWKNFKRSFLRHIILLGITITFYYLGYLILHN